MAECSLALQSCSLIGLENSPDLLRCSLLHREGSQNCLLWDSKGAHTAKVVQRLAFTPAAPGHNSSASSLARAVAACELSLRVAGNSILDSSLPLFSESPAIAGKQLPRSRFRKRGKTGAAGPDASASAGQHSILQPKQQQAVSSAANSGGCVDCSSASSACLQSSQGVLGLDAGSQTMRAQPLDQQQQQWDGQHCYYDKENCCPSEADPAAATDTKAAQPTSEKNDLSLLQALLDDSNCSAASLLQPSLAILTQPSTAPGTAAEDGSNHCYHDLRYSGVRASAGSDVSEFQGFWGPRSVLRTPFSTPHTMRGTPAAGVLPTPDRLLLTAAAAGGAAMPAAAAVNGSNGARGSLECLSSCDSWLQGSAAQDEEVSVDQLTGTEGLLEPAEAAAEVGELCQQQQQQPVQQQQGWDQLLLLLSLDESVSLMQVASQSCEVDMNSQTITAVAAGHSQQVDAPTQLAEIQRPPSTESLATDGSEPTSPTVLPAAGMLSGATSGNSWGGFGLVSSRYSDCCPSPASSGVFGSPTVLLSSPVLQGDAAASEASSGAAAASRHRSVLKQKGRSSTAIAETAAAGVAADVAQSLGDQSGQPAVAAAPSAPAACSSADSHAQQMQRPNSIEHSPIRGVTLWDNNGGSPSVASWLGSPGSTPTIKLQELPQDPQQFVLAPNSAVGSAPSPQWHLGQQQQPQAMRPGNALLQQLLDESCESWVDSGTPSQQLPQTPGDCSNEAMPAPAAAADFVTPQHGQQQQVPGGNKAAVHDLASSLRLRLPETHSAMSLSPCVSPSRSPAESVDSFTFAAAGEPYSSIDAGEQQQGQQTPAQEWSAYNGLGEVLTPGSAVTPAAVICKNGWAEQVAKQAGDAAAAAAAATPEPFAAASQAVTFSRVSGGPVKWQKNPSALLDSVTDPVTSAGDHASVDGCSTAAVQHPSSSSGADVVDAAAVQELTERLALAELQCGKHQQEAMQARQVALEKELELQVLRSALKISEVEGSSCLDALAATIDLIAAADGNSSVSGSVELPIAAAGGPAAPASYDAVAEKVSSPTSSSSAPHQQLLQQETHQLQQQNAALLQHNAAMQATMAEAAQQLDILEARVTELSAEKAAAEALLSEAEQQWNEQLRKQEEFTQSELDEQQQQHEEEVRDLHNRLEDLSSQLQQTQQEVSCQADRLQQLQTELRTCQQELSASQQQARQQQQQVQELQQQLEGRASDSAASTEQLQRQVQQLLAAKRELQEANARLIDAEAEYASNQMMLGCRNQELATQLKDAQAANKQLEDTVSQLQAQNSSLSQMCQNLKATAAGGGQAPTAATAASHSGAVAAAGEAADAGPTPMRRRMAAVNQQLERRCQELLEQKQQLALQLQQQQQGSSSATAGSEQQQALLQELHAQVEHLSSCNDELLVQLQDLDFEHQQLLGEREHLVAEVGQLKDSLAQLREVGVDDSRAAADADSLQDAPGSATTAALEQDIAELQRDNAALLQDIEQLQAELLATKQQLAQHQQQNTLLQNQLASACADAAAATSACQQKEENLGEARSAAAAAAAQSEQLQAELLATKQQLAQHQQQNALLQNQLASACADAAAATSACQQKEENLGEARSAAAAAAAQSEQLTKQLAAAQQQLDDAVQQQMQQQQAHDEQLQMSNTALFARCQELESQLQQMHTQLQQQQREHEQQLLAAAAAAAAPRGNKDTTNHSSSSNSNPAKRDQDQLIVELRGRLKEVLDLLEEKQQQQLQEQQAKHHAAREAELVTKCSALAEKLQDAQQQIRQLQTQHEKVVKQASSLSAEKEQLLNTNNDLQQQLAAAGPGTEAAVELHLVQQKLASLQSQDSEVTARLASMSNESAALADKCSGLQQRLAAAELGRAAAEHAAAAAGATALDAEKAAAAAERSVAELERAVDRLQGQNQSLVEQIVQLQLVDPAAAAAVSSRSKAVQVELLDGTLAAAAISDNSSNKHRRRWTSDLAVQVDLGATTEQATAVQQLLLLQAQQQLQDMEQQNKQAAQRLVESKARMTELQSSIQQQEQQLKRAEQQLAQATKLHEQQAASLQGENEQLVRQLGEARKQLAALQAANKQLEAKVQQQQLEVERQHQQLAQKQQELQEKQQALMQHQAESDKKAAAVAAAEQQVHDLQQLVQGLQQQQTLDKLQVATAATELQKAKEHAQQLLSAKDRDAASVAALQQQVQQLQLQEQQQAAAGSEAAAVAAAAREAAVREELGRSKQQMQLLLQEKEALVVELQQTKVAVDFLEDSVRRLGQHNASLVQQLHDTIAAAAVAADATQASSSKAAAATAAQPNDTSPAAAGSGGPVSPRTLQQIIAAATKVNEKNKRLKKQLQALQISK